MTVHFFLPPVGLQSRLSGQLYATTWAVVFHTEGPQYAFLRHGRIFQSDVGKTASEPGPRSNRLPPIAPDPSLRARREDRALPIVPMSSDRLFLERVARQHCPSPLHRRDQINMHSGKAASKQDISTLRGIGHFYFALTDPQK